MYTEQKARATRTTKNTVLALNLRKNKSRKAVRTPLGVEVVVVVVVVVIVVVVVVVVVVAVVVIVGWRRTCHHSYPVVAIENNVVPMIRQTSIGDTFLESSRRNHLNINVFKLVVEKQCSQASGGNEISNSTPFELIDGWYTLRNSILLISD